VQCLFCPSLISNLAHNPHNSLFSDKLEYLQNLYRHYQKFIEDISRVIPVISVDYDRFATAEEMAKVIQSEYLAHSFKRNVTLY
jgi:deoxyadenosine/deoxycytidine kinase